MSESKVEIELSDDMEKEFENMAERKLIKYSEQLDNDNEAATKD